MADWAGPSLFVPQFCSEGPKGQTLRCCYVYIEKFTLRTKIFGLVGWDPRLSFVSCGNKKEGRGEAFPLNQEDERARERKWSWMRKLESLWAQKGAFSLLMVALPQLYLEVERQEVKEPRVWVCVALDCRRNPLDTVSHRASEGQQEPLPPTSGDSPCWPPSLPGSGAVSTTGEEMKLPRIAMVFEICFFKESVELEMRY